MRILIYGGSFNPPHLGHVRSVETTAGALHPDEILLIPASVPPHKALAQDSPSAEERLYMTRLAAKGIDAAQVLDLELRRGGKSYTSDTLRELRVKYPEAELVLLVGTDMLISLPDWHEPEVITSLASVAVFSRETGRQAEIERAAREIRRESVCDLRRADRGVVHRASGAPEGEKGTGASSSGGVCVYHRKAAVRRKAGA